MISKQSSFTLIELLVVIVIVGILAGIIIVSMTGATNQATIAKAKIFSGSMRDSMANSIVSEWTFDELSTATNGTTVKDSWGNNNGTISSGSEDTSEKIYKDCVYNNCIELDGIDDYINIPNSDSLNLGDGNIGSVEIWAKIPSFPPGENYPSLIKKGSGTGWRSGSYHISYWSGLIHFVIYSSLPNYDYITTNPPSLNTWHHYVLTWRGVGNTLSAYIDGKLIESTNQTVKAAKGVSSSLVIGSNTMQMEVDSIRIYSSAIPTAQVKQNYVAGITQLLAKNQIARQEYEQRIADLEFNLAKN